MGGDRANTAGTVISDCMMEGRGQEGTSQKSTGRPHLLKNVKDKPSLLHCVHLSEVCSEQLLAFFVLVHNTEKSRFDFFFCRNPA